MTRAENKMLTMKIIKLLGIAGIAILAASFMATRAQRRDEEERRRQEDEERRRAEEDDGSARGEQQEQPRPQRTRASTHALSVRRGHEWAAARKR